MTGGTTFGGRSIGEQDIEYLARECPEFFDDDDVYE